MLLNVKCRGQDGLTPWQRVRGRPFNQPMLGFGEMVLHKLPPKDPKSNLDGNMGSRWGVGAFLGFHRQSRTYIVATADGKAPLDRQAACPRQMVLRGPGQDPGHPVVYARDNTVRGTLPRAVSRGPSPRGSGAGASATVPHQPGGHTRARIHRQLCQLPAHSAVRKVRPRRAAL